MHKKRVKKVLLDKRAATSFIDWSISTVGLRVIDIVTTGDVMIC